MQLFVFCSLGRDKLTSSLHGLSSPKACVTPLAIPAGWTLGLLADGGFGRHRARHSSTKGLRKRENSSPPHSLRHHSTVPQSVWPSVPPENLALPTVLPGGFGTSSSPVTPSAAQPGVGLGPGGCGVSSEDPRSRHIWEETPPRAETGTHTGHW